MPISPTLLLTLLACLSLEPALAQSSPPTTLTAGTQLVILDVVVTDSKQNPVHNLSASDFTVFEDNVPEPIKNFDEHTSANATKPEPPPGLPPGTFTNSTSVPANTTLNILLLDTLNTPLDAQTYVHNQLRLYLKNSPPNVPIAIFGLSSRLWLLQPFTADPELLRSAINQKSLKASPLLNNAATGGSTESLSTKTQELIGGGVTPEVVVEHLKQFEAQHSSDDSQLRAHDTLEALNQLARYLAGLPGRKNLIWFSGSFPINILPDGSLADPFSVDPDPAKKVGQAAEHPDAFAPAATSSDKFRQTTDLLARSQVAVYPIDARGLAGPSVYSVEESGVQYDEHRHPNAFTNDLSKASTQRADENSTMLQMAEQTGGHAFLNTNGLTDAVTRSIDAGSNYYTLTYSPTNTVNDGKFRRIQLKLQRQGLTLAYRRGYYADAPSPTAAPSNSQANSLADPMHNAMIFGSPSPTQIALKVHIAPVAGDPEDTPATGNLSPPAAHLTGPYRRYDITINADPSEIVFTSTADGNHHASLQYRTYLYTLDGQTLNIASKVAEANLTPALYAHVLHTGLLLHQQISVPLKGDYYLRVGVHDVTADHDGALEIPVAAIKNLPPAPVAPPTPSPAQTQ